MKNTLLSIIEKLLSVKSLITLSLTILFIILACKSKIDGQAVLNIYTVVISFYFGTQYEKVKKE